MIGLDTYKTKDGFTVARLHYTAHPHRRTEEEINKLAEGYPGGRSGAAWRKEQEIDFTAYSGQLLCYDIIQNYKHKIIKNKYVQGYENKYGSLDWGRNNPASFHVYSVDENLHVHSAYEIYLNDISIPKFSQLIKECPYYNELIWISADPSMWNKNQEEKEDVVSLETKFRRNGIVLIPGKKDDETAINELLDRWDRLDENDPTFTISPKCPKQIWEFERLRFRELTTAMIEKKNYNEQLVDKDNHAWDDYKYFINRFLSTPDMEIKEEVSPNSPLAKMRAYQKRMYGKAKV